MAGSNQRLKLTFLVLMTTLMVAGAAAAEPSVTIDKQDKVIWLNDDVSDQILNAHVSCEKTVNETSGQKGGEIRHIKVFDPYGDEYNPEQPDGMDADYSFNAQNAETGKYFLQTKCEDGRDKNVEFYVDKLNVGIDSPEKGDEMYLGTEDTVTVKLTSEEGQLNYGGFEEVTAYIEGQEINSQEINFGAETDVNIKEIPVSIIDGDSEDVELEVKASYEEKKENGQTALWHENDAHEISLERWKIDTDYYPQQRISYRKLGDVNLTLSMMYEGEAVESLEARHFYLKRGEKNDIGDYEWFSGGFTGTSDDGKHGNYVLSLEKLPKLEEPDDYPLEVWFESEDYGPRKVGTIVAEKKFTFDGRVSDSDSRAVNTRFKLDSGEYFEQFSTDSRGKFSRRVLPDEYGFDVGLPQGEMHLTNVELKPNYTGNVNYDYFKNPEDLSLDLGGVKPINMMAVSFGYPFDNGRAEMRYNPAKTENPMQVKVFECVEWNFWARECISGWERISDEDVTLPPTEWVAKFPVTPVETEEYGRSKNVLLSAYVVGTNSELEVSRISLDSYRVPVGGDFKASGTVVSDKGPVESANVELALMDGDEFVVNASGTTNSGGDFSIDMDAPEKGNYTMSVAAEKPPYNSYFEEVDDGVWVYRETDLSMDAPDQIDLTLGETSTATFSLKNDGQTRFEDVSLSVKGPGGAEYNLSDTQFDSIDAGDVEMVDLNINLPSSFCSPSCAQYPKFTVNVDAKSGGKRVEDEFEIQSMVKRVQNSGNTAEKQTEEKDDGSNSFTGMFSGLKMDSPTGDFIQNQGGIQIALGLITIFTLALAGAIKKKKNKGVARRGRADLSRSVTVHRPKVSPSNPNPDESDSEIDKIAEAFEEDDTGEQTEESGDDEWFEKLEEEEQAEGETEEETRNPEQDEAEDEEDKEELEAEESEEPGDEEQESQSFECGNCGETFDTESGLKLHKEALH